MKTLIFFLAVLSVTLTACKKDHVFNYPKDGLKAYYTFDGHLNDAQNFMKAGVGTSTFVTGKRGKAVHVNGINDKLQFDPTVAETYNQFTISFWIKSEDFNANQIFLYTANISFVMAGGQLSLSLLALNNNSISLITPYDFVDWTHVVATYDGSSVRLYINNQLKAEEPFNKILQPYPYKLLIGELNMNYWEGSIDEVFFYKRSLTEAEINTLYKM